MQNKCDVFDNVYAEIEIVNILDCLLDVQQHLNRDFRKLHVNFKLTLTNKLLDYVGINSNLLLLGAMFSFHPGLGLFRLMGEQAIGLEKKGL